VGQTVRVIVEAGRSQFQGPEDAGTRLLGTPRGPVAVARVVATEGADLVAEVVDG
jgi:hypothetical protein